LFFFLREKEVFNQIGLEVFNLSFCNFLHVHKFNRFRINDIPLGKETSPKKIKSASLNKNGGRSFTEGSPELLKFLESQKEKTPDVVEVHNTPTVVSENNFSNTVYAHNLRNSGFNIID